MIFITQKPKLNVISVIFILAIYFSLVLNIPIFLHFKNILQALDHVDPLFVISIPVLLLAAANFIFIPFSLKLILKPFFIFLLLTASLASYMALKYNVIFDAGMMQNIFETSNHEALAYLNPSIISWFIITGVIPALLLIRTEITFSQRLIKNAGLRLLSMLVSLVVIVIIALFFYKNYASIGRNNPTLNREIIPGNYLYATGKYLGKQYFNHKTPYQKIGEDAKLLTSGSDKPTLVFLVIGETARNQNQSWGGYAHPTNEFTQQQPDAIYFSQVSSCGTETAVSVPCMFSNMERSNFNNNRAHNSDSLLDILQRAGVNVVWLDNDDGCKGVCDRVDNHIIEAKEDPTQCQNGTCYDQVLVDAIDNKIPANRDKNMVIGLHLIGSHGPTYYRRYPEAFRKFSPDCPRSDIENCTQEQLVNTYDNTIHYTDYVVNQLIEKLKSYQQNYNVALYYVSDHGESLGEKGLYLHGTPYNFAPKEQTSVPMIMWLPEAYAKANHIDLACVREQAQRNSYSHDNLFHTLLAMNRVQTSAYNAKLDILQSCKTDK